MAPLQSVLPCILVLGLFLIPCLETALTGPLKRTRRQNLDPSVFTPEQLLECLEISLQGGECDLEVLNQPASAPGPPASLSPKTALTGPLKRTRRQQNLDPSLFTPEQLVECLGISLQGGECNLEVPNQPALPPASSSPKAQCTCVKNHQCLDAPTIPAAEVIPGLGLISLVDTRSGSFSNPNIPQCNPFETCCVNIDRTKQLPSDPPKKLPLSKGKCARPVPQGDTLFLFEGNQAQFGQFPWMVAVMKQGGQDIDNVYAYVSGGSLIHERVVLTVAHNVKDYIGQEHVLKARLGEWDLKNDGEPTPTQDISVSKIVLHPAFDPISLNYDIAVLILAQPATFGPSVGLVCLPDPFQNFDGSQCLSSGWGTDVFGDPSRYAQILKAIALPAVDHQECQRKLSTTRLGSGFILHKSYMCAGGQVGKDTCTGDGGSPLVCQTIDKDGNEAFIQAGVVAWGIGCGTDIPAAYSSVSEVMPWIGEVLNEFKAPPFDVRRPSG